MASKGKAEKVTEAVLGGDGSPYAARVDGCEIVCAYNGNAVAKLPAASGEGVGSGCKRWTGAVRRELALAVSGALVARNLHGNLVYTVPANEGIDGDRLASGILVGLSFGGPALRADDLRHVRRWRARRGRPAVGRQGQLRDRGALPRGDGHGEQAATLANAPRSHGDPA